MGAGRSFAERQVVCPPTADVTVTEFPSTFDSALDASMAAADMQAPPGDALDWNELDSFFTNMLEGLSPSLQYFDPPAGAEPFGSF